tara:strand:+ start:25805 stop:26251 length:447 start_codon:yes stop_codon:yes gene_type:complete
MFKFNWILINKLALGSLPKEFNDFQKLNKQGIKSIMCLCSKKEIEISKEIIKEIEKFEIIKYPLPDHRYDKLPSINEVNEAVEILNNLIEKGPVFIHCYAGLERSPLICMAWLIKYKKLTIFESLQYLMEVNKGTNPLPGQLKILEYL